AQPYPDSDPRSSQYQEYQRRENEQRNEAARSKQNAEDIYGQKPSSPSGGNSAGSRAGNTDFRALGKELLRLPPLPDERNVLLGNWRLESGGPQSGIAEFGLTGRGATPGFGETMKFLSSVESGKFLCDVSFGGGITFSPKTYSSDGAAGITEGPIAYRSRNKKVIVAIPGDSRANPMPFNIAGPNRIVWADTCALVRVGAPGASTAANATTAPGNGRTGAAAPAVSTRTSSSPSTAPMTSAVVDGAAFRCSDGSILHVSFCQGSSPDSMCKLARADVLDVGALLTRSAIEARVGNCEAGGVRYGADNKAVFIR
ncbi:MAG TPA: hypothetical protein VE421_09180, partial [Burkholderiaceae bacterium]|nr:hypothetical protein [Burkholderiaceae bacterium]